MDTYAYSREKYYDDKSNAVLLRQDIHTQFDMRALVFVPKAGELVCYIVGVSDSYAQAYHNRPLLDLRGISKPYILARFAYAISSRAVGFVRDSKNGKVDLLVADGSEKPRIVIPDAPDFCEYRPPPKSRTPSPKKRGRSGTAGHEHDSTDVFFCYEDQTRAREFESKRLRLLSASREPSISDFSPSESLPNTPNLL